MQHLRLCVVVLLCSSLPCSKGESWGSLSHIATPVKEGLLAGWCGQRVYVRYVAFSVDHNADSFLADCIGGSRDLP